MIPSSSAAVPAEPPGYRDALVNQDAFMRAIESDPDHWLPFLRNQSQHYHHLEHQVRSFEDVNSQLQHSQATVQELNRRVEAANTARDQACNALLQAQAQSPSQLTPVISTPLPQPPLPAPSPAPRLSAKHPDPDKYDGTGGQVRLQTFVNQCKLKLAVNRDHFERGGTRSTEQNKLAYIASRLEGKAASRIDPLIKEDGLIEIESVPAIFKTLQVAFGNVFTKRAAFSDLLQLQHKDGEDFEAFFSEFQTLAAHAGIDESGLRSMLENKLNGKLTRLLSYQASLPEEYEEFVRMAQVLAYQDKQAQRTNRQSTKPGSTASGSRAATQPAAPRTTVNVTTSAPSTATGTHAGPMDLSAGSRKLTDAEKKRRHDLGLCHYCGKEGHIAKSCPERHIRIQEIDVAAREQENV